MMHECLIEYQKRSGEKEYGKVFSAINEEAIINLDDLPEGRIRESVLKVDALMRNVFKENGYLSLGGMDSILSQISDRDKIVVYNILVKSNDKPCFFDLEKIDSCFLDRLSLDNNISIDLLKYLLSFLDSEVGSLDLLFRLSENRNFPFSCKFSFSLDLICYTGISYQGGGALLISKKSVIDGVYFFKSKQILGNRNLTSLSPFFREVFQDFSLLNFEGDGDFLVTNRITETRPAHVFYDFLYADFELKNIQEKKYFISFSKYSSYFEGEAFPFLLNEDKENRRIFFRRQKRLQNDSEGDRYRSWLIETSQKIYPKVSSLFPFGKKVIWIGITSGERRSWINEEEGICKIIDWAQENFDGPFFVFDGYTGREFLDEHDREMIEYQKKILNVIIKKKKIASDAHVSLIGHQVLSKVAHANFCSFFITMSGTCANWVSNICKVPGVVHSSSKTLVQNANVNIENCFVTPSKLVKDGEVKIKVDKGRPNRIKKYTQKQLELRFTDYSIDLDGFIEFIDKAFSTCCFK